MPSYLNNISESKKDESKKEKKDLILARIMNNDFTWENLITGFEKKEPN